MWGNKINRLIKKNKRKRIKELSGNLDNTVFLDFDGVINLDLNNYRGPFKNEKLIKNINMLCLNYNFKIVVISSWRKYSNYKDILYNSGLDINVEILGCTNNLEKDRESEVIEYIEEHPYTNKFIIIDDKPYNILKGYQVKTNFNSGFDDEKYSEAINLINQDIW